MKVKFNNSTLFFQKSYEPLASFNLNSTIGARTLGVQQGTSTKSTRAYDVRNCSKIIVDGLKIRTSELGYFYNGDFSDTDLNFPSGEPEVLTTWMESHTLLQIVAPTPYVDGDTVENLEVSVPQGATLFIVYYRSYPPQTVDNVGVYKKE